MSIFHGPSFDVATPVAVGTSPSCVAAGDFNGDGHTDLATSNVGANNASVLLGNGDGTFVAHVEFPTGANPEFVVTTDLDGDGKDDLAIANDGSNSISVLRDTTAVNSMTATFTAIADQPTGTGPVSLVAVDLEGNGKLDLVATNLNDNSISILRNTSAVGALAFDDHVDLATGSQPSAIAKGDFDGNGRADLAVTETGDNAVGIFLAAPGSAVRTDKPTGSTPDGIAVADLDGDGLPDIATADYSAASVTVIVASGSSELVTGAMSRAVAIGDLNGDGKPDLVVANGTANSISIFFAR